MKKYLVCAAVGVLASAALLSACNEPTTAVTETKHDTSYHAYGIYYDGGVIVTDDGNEWEIEPENVKDGTPIVVAFDDAGTPNNIYDDEILEIAER